MFFSLGIEEIPFDFTAMIFCNLFLWLLLSRSQMIRYISYYDETVFRFCSFLLLLLFSIILPQQREYDHIVSLG